MENDFGEYIRHIVGSLKITKQEKDELAQEIRDHLILLREENEQKGMPKPAAEQAAMLSFGSSAFLCHKLGREMENGRSAAVLLLGLCTYAAVFLPYFFVFPKIPSGTARLCVSWIFSFLFLSPVGYFLPAAFKPMKSLRCAAGITALGGMLWETIYIFWNLRFLNDLLPFSQFHLQYFSFLLQMLSVGIVGCISGAVGYGALKAADSVTIFWKDRLYINKRKSNYGKGTPQK